MDLELERQLKSLGVGVAYSLQLIDDGYLVRTAKGNLIAIKEGLPEERENEVVLHELGHLFNDDQIVGNYRNNDRAHYLMEVGANQHMIRYFLRSYMDRNDLAPDQVNPSTFCESFGFAYSLVPTVAQILRGDLIEQKSRSIDRF